MRVLVVYGHPVATSFTAAVHREVLAGLATAGHQVRDLDLYGMDFQPIMDAAERLDYHDLARNQTRVADHIDHLLWAEALVFVYPTWWYGLPSMVQGWLERVWVPGVAFTLGTGNTPIRPGMTHIRKLAGVTSYGSPWWWIKVVGDPGRRVLVRGIKAICHRHCQTLWLGHYRMDGSTPESRARHLRKVRRAFERF